MIYIQRPVDLPLAVPVAELPPITLRVTVHAPSGPHHFHHTLSAEERSRHATVLAALRAGCPRCPGAEWRAAVERRLVVVMFAADGTWRMLAGGTQEEWEKVVEALEQLAAVGGRWSAQAEVGQLDG